MATAPWNRIDARVVGVFLTALLVVVILVGDPRGGSSDDEAAPETSASPVRLCGSLDRMAALRDQLVDGSGGASVAELRDAASRTREVGARVDNLDTQAEAGLEFFTGFFVDLPDEPTTQQLLSAGAPASVTDQAHADAFVSWLQGNCPAGASR